jgi:hypothetical protein
MFKSSKNSNHAVPMPPDIVCPKLKINYYESNVFTCLAKLVLVVNKTVSGSVFLNSAIVLSVMILQHEKEENRKMLRSFFSLRLRIESLN